MAKNPEQGGMMPGANGKLTVIQQNPIEEFINTMIRAGYSPRPPIIANGEIQRFQVGEKRNHDGYYILHLDGIPAGMFGDWRSGKKYTWSIKNREKMSTEEHKKYALRIKTITQKRNAEKAQRHAKAKARAKKILAESKPADTNFPYLVKKGVVARNLLQYGGNLVIPGRDSAGEVWTLQFIKPDGEKRLLIGGKKRGTFFNIMGTGTTIYICEGLATGLSVHQAMGAMVVVTFDAGNLLRVGKATRSKYPDAIIIYCADNDQWRPKYGNPGIKKATVAAEITSGYVAIPQFKDISSKPTDFNDLHQLEGIEAVQEQLEKNWEGNWQKPVLLDSEILSALPEACFSGAFREMIDATSAATETPRELAAGLSIGTLSAACHGKFIVNIKTGYNEPLCIWMNVALPPANRKSAVQKEITAPLLNWERKKTIELSPEIEKATIKYKLQDERLKSLRAKYARAKPEATEAIENEIYNLEAKRIDIPKPPKIWVDDITPEHLGTVMAENGHKMAILSSEGGIFETIGGRYNKGIPNLDIFLKGHSGDSIRVDRGSRAPVIMDNPALTFCLSPQPDVLKSIASVQGFRGRGLLARYLYLLPESNLGYRNLESNPVPNLVKKNFEAIIHSLLDIAPELNESNEIKPYVLMLSREGRQDWDDFALECEHSMRPGGKFENITDWAGKLPGAAARIAGLLHCAEHSQGFPWTQKISKETMDMALGFCRIVSQHTLAVFDLMGSDPAIDAARKVWQWVDRNKFEKFSARDCFQGLKGSFQRMDKLRPAFEVLSERHYIREQMPATKKAGRPSKIYVVNPALAEDWR